jgi:hypothetical protein
MILLVVLVPLVADLVLGSLVFAVVVIYLVDYFLLELSCFFRKLVIGEQRNIFEIFWKVLYVSQFPQ